MVSIKASYTKMLEFLGKELSMEEFEELLSFAKTEIDDYVKEEDMLVLDIKTSNRPDLWCVEGMIREIKGILDMEKGIPSYEVKESGFSVKVDSALASSRPYIACAIAKKINLDDFHIKQLMQHSEKIDNSYGRKRKRSSIGMYNLSMIQNPVLYETAQKTHKFIPLGYEKEMTLDKILDEHEKGLEFGQIVKDYGIYPILLSADGMTLSLPPVINSNDVGRITEDTTECLIEVTGTNFETVNVVLNILCQTMADHGADIYSVVIEYPPEIHKEQVITPILELESITVELDIIEKYLDVKIDAAKAKELMQKRRFECKELEDNKIEVLIPPYRKDILHWVDIAEEIAIALDYNKIGPTKWKVLTTGGLLPETESENLVREILVGASGIELVTNILTDPNILTTNVNLDKQELVIIENPVSQTYSVLRNQIFPNLINVVSKNTHEPYPQIIFEVGEVVKMDKNDVWTQTNAAFCIADADASFEDAHKRLHHLMKLLNTEYKIENITHPSFTDGRCGIISINDIQCGIIGEINPLILEKNQIWVPVVCFEVELPSIPTLKCKIKKTY
ncbi:MAG: phenylalanine--tRNA ligase subunit beta [Candidatus Heimdallarchaeota archaeon]|nr:phenylalanine--tRNA ligase subunit beta [Candidatus Heimdallarchaeota archaeon]MCK4875965.1 phenylalanine--tRNA ligase subunit beta [Candidatus Heimdallarchaeota archaeon]